MSHKYIGNLIFIVVLVVGIYFWSSWLIITHPSGAIVSWDEGFHGGSALFISQSLRNDFNFRDYTYILNDFKNGAIWYPPLWLFLAGPMGALFGPSVEIYRLATLIFSVLSIILVTLFVKTIADFKAGIIAGLTLSFVPVFIVYSHLMMREVPLLFAVSFALVTFYKYLTMPNFSSSFFIVTIAAFSIGVLAKIIGIILIFGTVLGFGLFLFLFHRKSKIWERFYSRHTLLLLGIAVLSFLIYRHFTIAVLHADPLLFHLNQTKQMTGEQTGILIVLTKTLVNNLKFYLTDFSHMPALTVLWFGSLFAYTLLKRSLLSFFLLIWTIVTYLSFTAVKPQAVQYAMSIFSPLSIATGLFWGEFLKYRKPMVSSLFFMVIIVSIIGLGIFHLDKSETIFWRTMITNQEKAVQYVIEHARFGERVISSGDGTRFLIRLLGDDKNLQTINGAAPTCPESVQDSTEWAILDYGPQNPIRLNGIDDSFHWIKQTSFQNSIEEIRVFRNTSTTNKVVLESENFITKRCVRFLLPGKNKIVVIATPSVKKTAYLPDSNLKIALKVNPIKTIKELSLSQDELIKNNGIEQMYAILVDQHKINQPTYFVFSIPENINFEIKRIEIVNEREM